MNPDNVPWSIREAARVFVRTLHGDLGGFQTLRTNLLNAGVCEGNVAGISYLVSGNPDGVPVLFFHGSPGNAMEWRHFLMERQDQYSIIAIDRPGFGPADKNPPDVRKDMEKLAPLLEYFSLKQKVILVGHSMGGGIAAMLAADHPDKVRGLVLVGASLDPALEKIHPVQRFVSGSLSRLLTRSLRHANSELMQYASGFLEKLRFDSILCPVALLHSRDDGLVPFANTVFARRNFINAASLSIMEFDSGGHFLNETRPQDIWRAIRAMA